MPTKRRETIVVVVGDSAFCTVLCRLLTARGYTVLTELPRDLGSVDLILADASLWPSVATQLGDGGPPVLLMRDGTDPKPWSGATALKKPFTPDALERAVRAVLNATADT
jgi:hypothetical protein